MAMTIGAGLALDGEKQFKQAISGINKDLSVLGSEMGKVTAQFDGNADSMAGAKSKAEVYNKQIDAQKQKIETLRAALANSAKEYGENDAKTKSWQISLNKAEAELYQTEKALKDTTETVKKSNVDWGKFGEGLAKVGALAATAVAALAGAATAAGSALVAASVSGAKYADDILTTSIQTGIATDKLQEYKYAAELVDVSVDTLTKSMAKQIKSMKGVQDGTKLSVDAYNQLGVQATNADGSLRDGQMVYWEVIDALGKMENETQRDALAMQILGKSAQELNPLIEAGSAKMNELAAQAAAAGYVLGEDALNQFGAFDDQLQKLKTGSEAAKNALGTILLPVLNTLAGDGVDLLGEFTAGINGANGDIGKMVDVVTSTLTQVIDKVIEYLPQLIDAGLKILGALGQGILDNLPKIIDAAITIINSLVDGLIDALPEITTGALEIISALAKSLGEMLPKLIPAIVDIVMAIVDGLIDNLDLLIDAAIAITFALAEGIIEKLPLLIEKVPEILTKLVDALIENAPKLLGAAWEMIKKLGQGLIDNLPEIWSAAKKIVDKVVDAVGSLNEKVKDIGKNMVKGIWDGITAMATWIKDKVTGFFGGVIDGVKDFLGIKSPSRVFAGIGENMALGLGDGFTDEMRAVEKQINKAVPTSIDMNGSYGTTGGASGGIAPVTIYATYNVTDKATAEYANKDLTRRVQGRGLAVAYR